MIELLDKVLKNEEKINISFRGSKMAMENSTENDRKPTRFEKLQKRKDKIEAEMKAIKARAKTQERRARARRLIQIGAISEAQFDDLVYRVQGVHIRGIEPDKYKALLERMIQILEESFKAEKDG
jgi:hypothetical protein